MSKPSSELRGRMSDESRKRAELTADAMRAVTNNSSSLEPELSPEEQIRIDQIWAEEAERRLNAYRAGRVKSIPAEEIFGDE
jgi:hypothetical protein